MPTPAGASPSPGHTFPNKFAQSRQTFRRFLCYSVSGDSSGGVEFIGSHEDEIVFVISCGSGCFRDSWLFPLLRASLMCRYDVANGGSNFCTRLRNSGRNRRIYSLSLVSSFQSKLESRGIEHKCHLKGERWLTWQGPGRSNRPNLATTPNSQPPGATARQAIHPHPRQGPPSSRPVCRSTGN